jgi:hypothetical protein
MRARVRKAGRGGAGRLMSCPGSEPVASHPQALYGSTDNSVKLRGSRASEPRERTGASGAPQVTRLRQRSRLRRGHAVAMRRRLVGPEAVRAYSRADRITGSSRRSWARGCRAARSGPRWCSIVMTSSLLSSLPLSAPESCRPRRARRQDRVAAPPEDQNPQSFGNSIHDSWRDGAPFDNAYLWLDRCR